MKEISSRDNQWVKLACSLKNKKGRQGSQRVFMEGFRLIEDAALSGIMDVQCFVSPDGRERQGFGVALDPHSGDIAQAQTSELRGRLASVA